MVGLGPLVLSIRAKEELPRSQVSRRTLEVEPCAALEDEAQATPRPDEPRPERLDGQLIVVPHAGKCDSTSHDPRHNHPVHFQPEPGEREGVISP
jgi:hypothetical protein